MNCAGAREALALDTARDPVALARHLLGCPRCAQRARIDRRIEQARRWLVAAPPPRVDVQARVVARIHWLEPSAHDEIPAWQLGLSNSAAALAVVALVGLAWSARPDWQAATHVLDGLAQALAHVLSALGAIVLAASRAVLRLLSAMGAHPALGWASRIETAAWVGVGLSYATVLGAILRVLERDLRRARPCPEERRP